MDPPAFAELNGDCAGSPVTSLLLANGQNSTSENPTFLETTNIFAPSVSFGASLSLRSPRDLGSLNSLRSEEEKKSHFYSLKHFSPPYVPCPLGHVSTIDVFVLECRY